MKQVHLLLGSQLHISNLSKCRSFLIWINFKYLLSSSSYLTYQIRYISSALVKFWKKMSGFFFALCRSEPKDRNAFIAIKCEDCDINSKVYLKNTIAGEARTLQPSSRSPEKLFLHVYFYETIPRQFLLRNCQQRIKSLKKALYSTSNKDQFLYFDVPN